MEKSVVNAACMLKIIVDFNAIEGEDDKFQRQFPYFL